MALSHYEFVVSVLSISLNNLFSLAFTLFYVRCMTYYPSSILLAQIKQVSPSSVSDQLIELTKLSFIFYFYIFLPFSIPCQVFRISFVGKSAAGLFLGGYVAQSNQITSLRKKQELHTISKHTFPMV